MLIWCLLLVVAFLALSRSAEIAKLEEAFLSDPDNVQGDDLLSSPEIFSRHTPEFFSKMTRAHITSFLMRISRVRDQEELFNRGKWNTSVAASFIEHINGEDLASISDKQVCFEMHIILDLLKDKAEYFQPECTLKMLQPIRALDLRQFADVNELKNKLLLPLQNDLADLLLQQIDLSAPLSDSDKALFDLFIDHVYAIDLNLIPHSNGNEYDGLLKAIRKFKYTFDGYKRLNSDFEGLQSTPHMIDNTIGFLTALDQLDTSFEKIDISNAIKLYKQNLHQEPARYAGLIKILLKLLNVIAPPIYIKNSTLKFLPVSHLKAQPLQFIEAIEALGGTGGSKMEFLELKQFSALIEDASNCSSLDPKFLGRVPEEFLKVVGRKCFANIRDLDKTNIKNVIVIMKSDVLSEVKEVMNKSIYKHMRKDQAARLHKDQCAIIPMQFVGPEGAPGITGACLAAYLKGLDKAAPALGERFWENVNDKIFESFTNEQLKGLSRIHKDDWVFMQRLMGTILSREAGCAGIGSDAQLQAKENYKVTAECLAKLKPAIQAFVLATVADLPSDVLSKVTDKMAGEWTWDTTDGETVTGLAVLNHLKSQTNAAEVVRGLSTKVSPGQHACRLLTDAAQLFGIAILRDNMTQACFEAKKCTLDKADLDRMPNVFTMQPFSQLKTQVDEAFWKDLGVDKVQLVFSGEGKLCAEIDEKTFNLVPVDSLAGMTAKCLVQLTFKKALTKERVAAMPSNGFQLWEASHFAGFDLSFVTDAQLPFASEGVPNIKVNVATLFTAAVVETMSPLRVAKITARQWSAVPPSSFKAINKERFAAIPPEAMSEWTRTQVSNMAEDVLVTITKQQAALIGVNVKEADENPAKVFVGILSKLEPEARSVIQPRCSGTSATIVPTLAALFLAGGVALFA